MRSFLHTINYIIPLLSLVVLIYGILKNRINITLVALWLALIAFLIHYRLAGGEILGSYFDYTNATIYTLEILVIVVAFIHLVLNAPRMHPSILRYLSGFLAALIVVGGGVLLVNLWVNARFIENRLPGSAIIQVVSPTPPPYCKYRYVFYRVDADKKISYLCPNYFGLIPSVGNLESPPEFIARQLAGTAHGPLG